MARTAQDFAAEISALSPIELTTSRIKALLILPVGIGFTLIGVWMIGDPDVDPWAAWLCTVFFGLCSVIIALSVIRPTTLRLDRDGFSVRSPIGKGLTERWADVDDFGLRKIGKAKQIMFRLNREPRSTAERASQHVTGAQGALPGYYRSISRGELAALLQRYRDAVHGKLQ